MKNWPPTPQQSHRLKDIGIAASLALLLLSGMIATLNGSEGACVTLMVLGVAVCVLGVGQHVTYCRCPHCGESFNIRAAFPQYCPNCGTKMED